MVNRGIEARARFFTKEITKVQNLRALKVARY